MIRIAVPPGIGDALWSLTKVEAIKREAKAERCMIVPQNTTLNRSIDFLQHFDFVDVAQYESFEIHYAEATAEAIIFPVALSIARGMGLSIEDAPAITAPSGEYNYVESQKDYLGKFDWLLIANGHLERGRRLEEWLPQFETDFRIGLDHFEFSSEEISSAERYHRELLDNNPFIVFYLGPKTGNTVNGHNRRSLWSLGDWEDVARLMLEINENLRFVLVGAQYDFDYALQFLNSLQVLHQNCFINLVGKTSIGLTFALIKKSNFVLSYQSGIGIFSCYLGVPTGCFWRPYGDSISPDFFLSFQEAMASAWAAPYSFGETGNYLPLIYTKCSPLSIADEFAKRGWFNNYDAKRNTG